MDDKQCCGTCKYRGLDQLEEFICTNVDSDSVGASIAYNDVGCNDWEGENDSKH